MKKLIALLVCTMMLISIVIVSFASPATVSKTLTSTSTYVNALYGGGSITRNNGYKKWNAPFYGASDSQRVVLRVYQLGNTETVASSTWVYSAYSTTSHPYKAGFQSGSIQVFPGAKIDDRDEGPITISGTFDPNRN